MGFLSAYSTTRKVSIGDQERGYWVELREYISQGDKTEAERALQGRQHVNGTNVIMDMDVARYRQLMLLASIVSWNLDDDGGRIWPINLQNVQRLPGPEFDRLWSIVDDLNAPATGEERRRFPGGDDDGDQGGSAGRGESEVPGNVLASGAAVAAPWHDPGAAGATSVA